MPSSTTRCEFCRLHRNPTTACECQQRMQEESPTLAPRGRRPLPIPDAPVIKRGRGRPRKERISLTEPEPDQETSSPLARIGASVRNYWLRSQGTPPQSPALSQASSEELLFDLEMDNDNIVVASAHHPGSPALMVSPASTQIVAETPLAHLLAQQEDQPYFDQAHSPNVRRSSSKVTEFLNPDANVHFAVHADPAIEIQRLRQSRTQLAQNLQESTDHVNRLHARLLVYAGDKTALTAELGQARLDREMALVDVGRSKRVGYSQLSKYAISVVVTIIALCLMWGWVNEPDFAYIRKRQAEVLCE